MLKDNAPKSLVRTMVNALFYVSIFLLLLTSVFKQHPEHSEAIDSRYISKSNKLDSTFKHTQQGGIGEIIVRGSKMQFELKLS